MPKPDVTRVQSATQSTASVHTLHMPKPYATRVQSATQWTASVHTLHMPKPDVTRVQSATQWTASVHTLHMPKHFTHLLCSGQLDVAKWGMVQENIWNLLRTTSGGMHHKCEKIEEILAGCFKTRYKQILHSISILS